MGINNQICILLLANNIDSIQIVGIRFVQNKLSLCFNYNFKIQIYKRNNNIEWYSQVKIMNPISIRKIDFMDNNYRLYFTVYVS